MRYIIGILISGIAVYALFSYKTDKAPDKNAERRIVAIAGTTTAITADINDPDDAARNIGVDIPLGEDPLRGKGLSIDLATSNPAVVPLTHLILSGTGNTRNLKISAISPGYSTITIKIGTGEETKTYILEYAASQTMNMENKHWHAGICDASAAINIGDEYMVVANDESNCLYLYNRNHTGTPLKTFDYNQNNILGLVDSSAGQWKEIDVEGGVRSMIDPSLTYWIGSMSNNSGFFNKPNRNRLFAVNISGKGNEFNFKNQGYYSKLREKLITWGDAYGYDFRKCSAVGKDCKTIDGFNIEGMVFGPDNKTLFIGFRAPLVPMNCRTKAVIAPIYDFENWFIKQSALTDPVIGSPIELDLGGRGIRDIIRLSDGNYIIIAGSCGFEITPAAYKWTGYAADAPTLLSDFDLSGLNVEGVVPVCENGKFRNKLQLLTDNGNEKYYCDTLCAKDLPDDRLKKFSSVIMPLDKK